MRDALQFNVCRQLLDLYCLYRSRWVRMCGKKTKTEPKSFDVYTLMNHIEGKEAVCVFSGKHATKFLTVDVDLLDPDIVHKVIDTMVEMGIPKDHIYVSFSGGKGYHVDIFFRNYVFNNYTQQFYWAMIDRSGLDPAKVEFRPTTGQAIKLPLGVHQKTGLRCWFVDRDTLEPIQSFDPIFHIEKIDQGIFENLVRGIMNEYMRKAYGEEAVQKDEQSGGGKVKTKVCFDSLKVEQEGTRHNIQAKVAGRARMNGLDYDEIVQAQMDWYAQQDKSKIASSEEEVRAEAEALAAWAVKTVHVKNNPVRNNDPVPVSKIRITKQMVPYILKAPTKAGRLVMFLLTAFCAKYDDVQMSMQTIANYVGVSVQAVSDAIGRMAADNLLVKTNTMKKKNKLVTLRGANMYKVPGTKKLRSPDTKHLNADHYDIVEMITKENLHEMCFRTLLAICKPEYLKKYMTRSEYMECMQYKEGVTADGGAGAAADA